MLAALGAALFASANYSDAAARLCEASDLNPTDPAPYVFLGKIDMAAPEPLPCVESKLLRYNQEQPGDARDQGQQAAVGAEVAAPEPLLIAGESDERHYEKIRTLPGGGLAVAGRRADFRTDGARHGHR